MTIYLFVIKGLERKRRVLVWKVQLVKMTVEYIATVYNIVWVRIFYVLLTPSVQ